jgi:putative transposase
MPRANRHHIPGQVWHITHRCHKREFLFRFAKDRTCWLQWLHEAKKRHNLCILNYIVTSNHIHLLVVDDESDVISSSIQLIAGRTAQAFNRRKGRKGAYWEDRYHATAQEWQTPSALSGLYGYEYGQSGRCISPIRVATLRLP